MGKKGRKTRWRKLPIPIGNGGQRQSEEEDDATPSTAPPASRTTFNEDEYTKITTPRQDMLFKKGYLGRKKATPTPSQDTADTQSAESIESEQYCCEEQIPQYMYPAPAGYIDHTGTYYMNSMYPQPMNYEVFDPYTGGVTVVVGPAPQFAGPHPMLAAMPYAPVPLQSVEWFAPPPHHTHAAHQYNSRKKSSNSVDSQNWSGQSSESTCPPGSPQDPTEQCEMQPYVYPGYMFGPPVYNVNGMNVQTVLPPITQTPSDQSKRRKKRRRRRRGGVTDDGSESSCEEVCSLEAPGSSASSSKTNSDSGIATDPCGASGGQGSLSSLSNDEADKDNKSIPSEANSPTEEVKEERILEEVKKETVSEVQMEQLEVEQQEVVPVEVTPVERAPVEVTPVERAPVEVTLVEMAPVEAAPVEVAPVEVVKVNVAEVEAENADEEQEEVLESTNSELPTAEPVLLTAEEGQNVAAESVETIEEIPEECQEITEQLESTELTQQEEECTAEAFSDDEFDDNENLCSSDDSTLPCTADDHSIEESHTELELINRISDDTIENRLQEEDTSEEDKIITGFNDISMYDLDHLELEPLPEPPPVAPPRRKKCAKVAEKLATRLADEIVADAVSCAAEERWPITSAVTKWLEDSEDEIEEAEEATGQKNGEGNPFLAPFHSGSGTRVASTEWYNSRVREMCDPIASVNKYYRLALPIKTGPGPFPCGICCIIQ